MKVRCTITVDVDTEVVKKLGYNNVDEYLNECNFSVVDDNGKDICSEVEEYEPIEEDE